MKKAFIFILFFIFGSCSVLSAEEYKYISDAICESAQRLYKDGMTEQALRELNKCFMVQPGNKCCNRLLDKIQKSPQEERAAQPCAPQPVKAPKVEAPVKTPVKQVTEKKITKPSAPQPVKAPKVEAPLKIPVVLNAPETGCINEEIAFLAAVTGEPDPDRMIYRWDFSDIKGLRGQKVSRVFKKPGIYKAKLTVTDPGSPQKKDKLTASLEKTIQIFDLPDADAGADAVACVGSQVVFDGSKSKPLGDPRLKYSWDFGDATTAEGAKATHVYNKPRVYWVKLTVTNNGPAECSTSVDMKEVKVFAPALSVAKEKEMLVKITSERPGVKFEFKQPKISGVQAFKYSWDFGDGSKAEGNPVYHVYQKGTDFTVKLTIDDGLKMPCSVSTQIIKVSLDRSAVVQEDSSR